MAQWLRASTALPQYSSQTFVGQLTTTCNFRCLQSPVCAYGHTQIVIIYIQAGVGRMSRKTQMTD